MSIITKRDAADAGRKAIALYEEQVAEYEEQIRELKSDKKRLSAELDETFDELARKLIPRADARVVERVARELRSRTIQQRLGDLDRELALSKSRVSDIESSEDFQTRDGLLDPDGGELVLALADAKSEAGKLKQAIRRYDKTSFHWLMKRDVHKKRDFGAFSSFWRTITLASRRENKRLEQTLTALGASDFGECVEAYKAERDGYERAKAKLELAEDRHAEVVALVEEQAELRRRLDNWPEESNEFLRRCVVAELEDADLDALHKRIRPAGKPLVAKAHAIVKKLAYLDDLLRWAKSELADREKRIASISKCVGLWRRKPYGRLDSDKSKWLVTVPKMKRDSTRKRVGWARRSHRNICDYDDWDDYSDYMDDDDDFLAYDAFGYGAEERMPWEGFSREVFSELDETRTATGQEKADYSALKECKKGPSAHDGAAWEEGDPELEMEDSGGGGIDAGDVAVAVAAGAVAGVVAHEMLAEDDAGAATHDEAVAEATAAAAAEAEAGGAEMADAS